MNRSTHLILASFQLNWTTAQLLDKVQRNDVLSIFVERFVRPELRYRFEAELGRLDIGLRFFRSKPLFVPFSETARFVYGNLAEKNESVAGEIIWGVPSSSGGLHFRGPARCLDVLTAVERDAICRMFVNSVERWLFLPDDHDGFWLMQK